MNLIVGTTAFLSLKYFFFFKEKCDYIITFFILFFTQIVLSQQLLGIANVLYLANVILLNLGILFTVFIIIKVKNIKPRNNLGFKFTFVIDNLTFNKIVLFSLAVILGFGLVKIAINLVNPPFGWDSLNYHFSFPVEWLKQANLANPISISGDPAVSYYPINGSLFFLWFIFPLKNVFLADLSQVPFFIISFLAVYSLAKKLDLSKEYAFFSASLFILIPNYFKQLEIAYIDVMVACMFLATLNYIFLLYKDSSWKNIILFSLSLGLMVGIKSTAITFTLLLFIPFLYFCFSNFELKKAFVLICLSVFLIILIGGFGYIRNIIQTGNPLYPLNLKLFGRTILKGVVDNAIYRTATRPGDFSLVKMLFSEGLGAQTLLFVMPAIFLGLPTALRKRKKDLDFNLIYFMILPLLLFLCLRILIPLPNLRYIYALFAIALIIAFYTIKNLKLPKPLLPILIVICLLASIAELASHLELIMSLLLSLVFFAILLIIKRLKRIKITFKTIICLFLTLGLLFVFLEKDYIKNEHQRYVKMVDYSGFWPDATHAWAWLNQETSGNNIAYIGRPVPFPLYGSYFKNNVYYVSVNEVEPAMLHYFLNSKYIWGHTDEGTFRNFDAPGNYRGGANYNIWLKNLLAHGTDYLFIYSELLTDKIQFPIEEKWASNHPEEFSLAFINDTIRIYKIIK
ncbi:MAG: hypothetical protein KJ593_05950 [Candidatus Omnitrophica bacterium]|nr:hypothetical protein [Candidatus Omnitrophota bacterium]